jgi:hypothetical protein
MKFIRSWACNTKIDSREIGWGGMDWIHLAQDRERWPALMNVAKTFSFHEMWGILQ